MQTEQLLQQLCLQLQQASLWANTPPTTQAMASTAPFACDSMPFEHWLQFIFVPRMRELITNGQPLPTKIGITPMAEHVYASRLGKDVAIDNLITTLSRIDVLLSGAE